MSCSSIGFINMNLQACEVLYCLEKIITNVAHIKLIDGVSAAANHNLFEVNHCAQEKLILMYGINEIKQIYKMFVNALVQMCNIFVYSMSFVPCTSNKFLPVRQGLSLEEIESFTLQSSL